MLKKYNRTSVYVAVALSFSIGLFVILYMQKTVYPTSATFDTSLISSSFADQENSKGDGVNFLNPQSAEQYSFTYILADTEALRQKGLSGRASLGDKEVMLFTFEKPDVHFFWMKDMFFSIDIVWLDSNKKVIHIEHQVTPQTYPKSFGPTSNSLYVLEFNADTAKSIDLRVGDTVEF